MNDDDPASGERGRKDGLLGALRAMFGQSDRNGEDYVAAAGEPDDGEDAISASRRAMIERVVAFDQKMVFDVMAPRADISAVDADTPLKELVRCFAEAGHSRMPIYRDDLDDPIGMAHIKDVVALLSEGADPEDASVLKTIRRDLLYVPPSMRVTDLLLRMQASRIHMALVIDEYGGTDGLVTIEDLIEEIVGEINDEHDDAEDASVIPRPGGGWDADARIELEAFTEETALRLETEDDEIDTLGGYVVSLAGRVPQRGEIIAGPAGFDFEITEADERKVRRIRVRPAAVLPADAAE